MSTILMSSPVEKSVKFLATNFERVIMGCGLTKAAARKRSSTSGMSVDDLKTKMLQEYKQIQKRFGHPTYYQFNGYDIKDAIDKVDKLYVLSNGLSRQNHAKVAIKERHMLHCVDSDVIQEVLILSNLSHKCLPQLYEVFITDSSVFTVTCAIDTSRLSHCLEDSQSYLTVPDAKHIMRSILEATEHCHSKNIIIRNLSPHNICVKRSLDGNLRVKIADFALAVVNGSNDYICDSQYFNWSQVNYLAPEALLGDIYTPKMDMWSIGVLMLVMITGKLPFQHDDDIELMRLITNAIFEVPKSVKIDLSFKTLINHLICVSSDQRLTPREALKQQWLQMEIR